MEKPVLVIMAAGMGSRYGGQKQIDPVDEYGNIIMDFSIYDARQAGFEKAVFIIKREQEEAFREAIGNRISRYIRTDYVYQELGGLPDGAAVPQGRVKPWGTGHAILSCADAVKGPFAVINADDYYGREAFQAVYRYLSEHEDDEKYRFAMVGYRIENTLTENGTVARGVCQVDDAGQLISVTERTSIGRRDGGIWYTEPGKAPEKIPEGTLVSMNLWGFSAGIFGELKKQFSEFLETALREDPLKAEFYIPSVVSRLVEEDRASVQVLPSHDRWFGVTYKEDKASVVEAIRELKRKGLYPEKLWE